MLAQDLVTEIIPIASGKDTLQGALLRMAELKVSHLPVVERSDYLGLLAETEIIGLDDRSLPVGQFLDRLLVVSVVEGQHVYEVVDLIARLKLSLLPVISGSKQYMGCITLPSLAQVFSLLTAAGQPGAILILSLAPQEYSPTIISRIIEDNNAKMISLYVVPDPGGRELTVTIKINTQETSSLMRSFERYGYTLKSYFLTSNQLDDFYRTRYEEFMKYINI